MNKTVFSGDVAPGNSGAFLCPSFTGFGRVPVALGGNYWQLFKSDEAMILDRVLSNPIPYI